MNEICDICGSEIDAYGCTGFDVHDRESTKRLCERLVDAEMLIEGVAHRFVNGYKNAVRDEGWQESLDELMHEYFDAYRKYRRKYPSTATIAQGSLETENP